MQGLITVLPQPYYDHVKGLWDELEKIFGITGIRVTPLPHFTWQVADDYTLEALDDIINAIAADTAPIEVHVKGAESFTSHAPVVFLKVLKSPALLRLHLRLWKKCLPLASEMNMLYSPVIWRPHISLAYQDLKKEQTKAVLSFIKGKMVDWTFVVESISLVDDKGTGNFSTSYEVQLTG